MTAQPKLVVGSDRPIQVSRTDTGRRWPSTVHAVGATPEAEPFTAMCGAFVLFKYGDLPWPPGTNEDSCPGCVRATTSEDRHHGV